jgi:hypothetical protein
MQNGNRLEEHLPIFDVDHSVWSLMLRQKQWTTARWRDMLTSRWRWRARRDYTEEKGRRLDDDDCPAGRDNGERTVAACGTRIGGAGRRDGRRLCGPAGRDGRERRRLGRPRMAQQDTQQLGKTDDDVRGLLCGCIGHLQIDLADMVFLDRLVRLISGSYFGDCGTRRRKFSSAGARSAHVNC